MDLDRAALLLRFGLVPEILGDSFLYRNEVDRSGKEKLQAPEVIGVGLLVGKGLLPDLGSGLHFRPVAPPWNRHFQSLAELGQPHVGEAKSGRDMDHWLRPDGVVEVGAGLQIECGFHGFLRLWSKLLPRNEPSLRQHGVMLKRS